MGIFFTSSPPARRRPARVRLAIEALEARVVPSHLSGTIVPLSAPLPTVVVIGSLQPAANSRAVVKPSAGDARMQFAHPVDPDEPSVNRANGATKAGLADTDHSRDDDRPDKERVSGPDGDDTNPFVVHSAQPAATPAGADTEARRLMWTSSESYSPCLLLGGDEAWPATNPVAAIAPPRHPGEDPSAVLADDAIAAAAADAVPVAPSVDTARPDVAEPRWFDGITAMLPVDTAALDAGMRRLLDAMANTTQELLSDPRPANFTLWVCMAGIGVTAAELCRRHLTRSAVDSAVLDLAASRSSGLRYRPAGSKP
jgi:hypothetical protein